MMCVDLDDFYKILLLNVSVSTFSLTMHRDLYLFYYGFAWERSDCISVIALSNHIATGKKFTRYGHYYSFYLLIDDTLFYWQNI